MLTNDVPDVMCRSYTTRHTFCSSCLLQLVLSFQEERKSQKESKPEERGERILGHIDSLVDHVHCITNNENRGILNEE